MTLHNLEVRIGFGVCVDRVCCSRFQNTGSMGPRSHSLGLGFGA